MENNKAFVAHLGNITKIEGADKIVRADVLLGDIAVAQIVTGVDTPDGQVVVYFDSNMCLNEKVLTDYPDLARYLGKTGRVKTVKLRGVISNGLVVPVEKFYKYDSKAKEYLVENYSFNAIGKQDICKKYEPIIKVASVPGKKGRKGKVESRMISGLFHFHIDTDQLLRNSHRLNPDQIISITDKWHGCSSICSNALVKKTKLSMRETIGKLFGKTYTENDYIYASRTVIKNNRPVDSGYYKEDIWSLTGKENFYGKLHKGETVYYEIVGFLPSGSSIQKRYDYSCKPCEHKIAVYRITMTNPDGIVTELGWQAVKERCIELGVPHVRELYFGKAKDKYPEIDISEHWNKNFVEALQKEYLDKKCVMCNNDVPNEGIVVRIERLGIEVYKLKSLKFILGESLDAESGETSIEDTQG